MRRPKPTLLVLLVLGVVLGSGVRHLEFDPSAEKVFPRGHPAVADYQAFREAFGADEAIFVAFEVPQGRTVFEREALSMARRISQEAGEIEGIERAVSLADCPVLRLTPLGPRLVPGLPPDIATASDADLERFQGQILKTPLVERVLVSRDHRSASAVLRLKRFPDGGEGARENARVVRQLQDVVEAERRRSPEVRFFLAGSPLIKSKIMDAILGDLKTFTGPLTLIALVVAWLVLRSAAGVVLTLAVLGLSIDLTLGTMGHLGMPLDPMTSLVPTLILVIGVADSLHLLVEQRAQAARLGPGASGAETVREAATHVFVPCLLTSLTTMIGFASLVTSPIPPIARFGGAAAVAAGVAFLVTMILIPAAGALLPAPTPAAAVRDRASGLARLVLARPWAALMIAVGISLAIGLGAVRLRADTDFLSFFPEDDDLVRSARAIQDRFVGVAPCEIVVAGPPGCSRDPATLRAVLALERGVEGLELVDLAFSAADVVAKAQGLISGHELIPHTRAEVERIEQLLRQVAGRELQLEQLIAPPGGSHPDEEWLRVTVRARTAGSARFGELVALVREIEAKQLRPLGLSARPTGTSVVFSESAATIVQGQIQSFFFAYLLITAVLTVALRSLRLGLLSILPNIGPVAALLGTMGYLGIPFNSFNSMVASIALGIAVDDTIHLLSGFQRSAATRPLRAAVYETLAREGTALISTSAVLFCGFCVLVFGTFGPTREFGLLTAVAIAVALLGDLLLLPALLLLFPALHGVRGAPEEDEAEGGEAEGPEAADGVA
ncbi:MAG: RND family transporter [Planctomycetota bacterium]